MDRQQRSTLAVGVLLILLGGVFLALQLVPGLAEWLNWADAWPLLVIGAGVALLLIGLLGGAPGLATPACLIGGIGALLYYQNATGDWASWAYAWTLLPGFVGIGTMLAGLLGEGERGAAVREGLRAVVASLVMFLIFGSFLGGPITLGRYWPVLLIVLGLFLLGQRLFPSRR